MTKRKPNFTQLTHDVVRAAGEALPFEEIVRRVHALAPITTKNPRQTLRNAIAQSRMIAATGDGRYGWKLSLINGARVRHTLQAAELAHNRLYWDHDVRDALWPTFFAIAKYADRSPAVVALPNGAVTPFALEMFSRGVWGTPATPLFWDWFHGLAAGPGDHLLFAVVDGEARQYRVDFQPRAARDEATIAERNEALVAVGRELRQRPYGIAHWDFTSRLLAGGFYHHPVPPDPFSTLWDGDRMAPAAAEPEPAPPADLSWRLAAEAYDVENPPDLPPEYEPRGVRRRARASARGRRGSVATVTLRVSHRALPDVWRDIELAEDNTLEDLHLVIQQAYRWWDDHLYSFFLSGRAWDSASEVASPWSEGVRHTHQVEIGRLELREGQRFLYLFDYGDEHEFDVTVVALTPLAPRAVYPRVVEHHGASPPQYPDMDEESGAMSWDPHRR